jgi:hypothetical protein
VIAEVTSARTRRRRGGKGGGSGSHATTVGRNPLAHDAHSISTVPSAVMRGFAAQRAISPPHDLQVEAVVTEPR